MHKLPLLPTLRELTAQLRRLHAAFAHPIAGSEYVRLICVDADGRGVAWQLAAGDQFEGYSVACTDDGTALVFGPELVPGDVPCTNCRHGWKITADEPGGPESCRVCDGTGRCASEFDAVAAARRLLAAARTGMHT